MRTSITNTDIVSNILGINISKLLRPDIEKQIEQFICSSSFHWIGTINPEIILESLHNPLFHEILNSSSLNVADGVGVLLSSYALGCPIPSRMTGADLIDIICTIADQKHMRVYLLGASIQSSTQSKKVLEKKFPNLSIIADADIDANNIQSVHNALKKMQADQPDIVFVALGAPQQEQCIQLLHSRVRGVKLAMGVGGALDMISGSKKRAPIVLRKIGMEWMWRVLLEPSRWARILKATILFPIIVILYLARMNFCYRKNVIALIYNTNQDILIVERKDTPHHWQLPQGGIEKHETLRNAFYREMSEEIGTNNLCVHLIKKNFFTYLWPKWHRLNKGYKGQKQTLIVASYQGNNDLIHLDYEELQTHRWVKKYQLVSQVHELRKKSAQQAINYLPF